MKYLLALLAALSISIANAQTVETTPNLITSGSGHTWSGVSTGPLPPDAMPGGPGALYDPNTNTIHFSYGSSTVAQTFAINQALQGTGIVVQGYNYSWQINNNNYDNRQGSTDTLTASVITYTLDGAIRRNDSWTYNTKFDWTTFSGTVNYANPGLASTFGNLRVQFSGADSGFWGGYFGPQVRDVQIGLNYTVDQCSVDPQSSPSCPGFKTYYQMWDDGYAQVNLPFNFPFYGFNFTTSYMFTNGVVGFLNPNNNFCCDGVDLHGQRFAQGSPWNFAIYALNTDLYPGPDSTFYTQLTNNGQGIKYTWDRAVEIGTSLENTFSVELRNSGYIGLNYSQINLNGWRNPLIGIAGDTYQLGYSQYYYGSAQSMPNLVGSTITFTGTETTDICASNPLSNPQCPGYAQAYFTQQCTFSPLYNSQCPGYAQAYFTQQCTINSLYSVDCPGYAQAYLNYQCSINPLYSTTCVGYQTATTTCNQNPLSHSFCPAYQTATTECNLNALYNSYCPAYQPTLAQCANDPLGNVLCPGYQFAYSCSVDGLYSRDCPNYADAYAKKNVLGIGTTTVTTTTTIVLAQATTDPVAQAAPVVADPVVNNIVSTKPATANAEANPAAVVKITAPSSTAAATSVAADAAKQDKKSETAQTAKTEEKSADKPKTAREQLAEQRREAAKKEAVTKGKDLANEMGKAADMAAQVEVQNVVIQAMGFTPGFDTYNRAIPDTQFYKPYEAYPGQRNVDSNAGRRLFGGSDSVHQQMTDSQYNLGK
jgi:hypothetical protein